MPGRLSSCHTRAWWRLFEAVQLERRTSRGRNKSEAWNRHPVRGVSPVLGVIGVVSAFVLLHPPRVDFMDGCAGHTDDRDADRGLWRVHDASSAGAGRRLPGAMRWPYGSGLAPDGARDQGVGHMADYQRPEP